MSMPMPMPGQFIPGPPQPYNNNPQMNPIQGSAAPPMQGQGYSQQQQRNYNYNMANEPEFVRGHNDMPHPGEVYTPPKAHMSRSVQILILGMVIGGVIMWRIFPIFDRVVKALFGG